MPDFINVPVPSEHVTKVYALLASLADGGGASGREQPQGPFDGWTDDDLTKLRDAQQATVRKIAQLMDVLAESPGQPVAYTELVTRLGVTRGELQGALSGFTRWIRKVWGQAYGWPMRVTYGAATTHGMASESYYTLTTNTARRWRTVRDH